MPAVAVSLAVAKLTLTGPPAGCDSETVKAMSAVFGLAGSGSFASLMRMSIELMGVSVGSDAPPTAGSSVKTVEKFELEGPIDEWRKIRAEIHDEVCAKAFNAELGAFTQAYGSKCLDASALLIPTVGFLPASDARVCGTVESNRTLGAVR